MSRIHIAFGLALALCLGTALNADTNSAVPDPSTMKADLVVHGNISTIRDLDVVCVGDSLPKTYAGKKIASSEGFKWWVTRHFALHTDFEEPVARKALRMLELAYPHWVAYADAEPEDIHDTRIALVYATR